MLYSTIYIRCLFAGIFSNTIFIGFVQGYVNRVFDLGDDSAAEDDQFADEDLENWKTFLTRPKVVSLALIMMITRLKLVLVKRNYFCK